MARPIIELQGVRKRLGGREVLRGLDLAVPRGETVVIMGRSGEGKSVILKHMVGLLRPDEGLVRFDGQRLDTMRRPELAAVRRRLGMLFQGAALFDSLTVGRNVALGLEYHRKLGAAEIRERVAAKLAAVGLTGIEERMPGELSGGMRKRVGLARALALDPEVILYDEPTTGLDPITADQINDLILELQRGGGVSGVVVTHDVASALKVGTMICLLVEGRVVFTGTPDQVRSTADPLVRQFIEGRAAGPLSH